jgi:hypothetical protein
MDRFHVGRIRRLRFLGENRKTLEIEYARAGPTIMRPHSDNPVYQDLAFSMGTKASISVSISNPGYRLTWGTGFY